MRDDATIYFNFGVWKRLGVNEAIVLQAIYYWVESNRQQGINLKNGEYWTYNSYKDFVREYDQTISESTVKRVLTNLKNEGLIKSGCYNDVSSNMTNWYTLTRKGLDWVNGKFDVDYSDINESLADIRYVEEPQPVSRLDEMKELICKHMNRLVPAKYDTIIEKWIEDDISEEIIILAIEDNEYRGARNNVAHIDETIKEWFSKGCTTITDIKAYCNKKHNARLKKWRYENKCEDGNMTETEKIATYVDFLEETAFYNPQEFVRCLSVMPEEYYVFIPSKIVNYCNWLHDTEKKKDGHDVRVIGLLKKIIKTHKEVNNKVKSLI